MGRFIPYQSSRALIEPTLETINALEQVIRWAEVEAPSQLKLNMDKLVWMMALVNQRFARKMSFGAEDPSQMRPELAWKLPVRRISGRYYLGWKIRQVRPAVWQLYNDSREAFFIEFGINWRGEGRRVRRPVRKLTLRQTLQFMMTTHAYHRIWADIFANPRHRHRGLGFTQIVQAPGGSYIVGWQGVSRMTAQNSLRASGRASMGQVVRYSPRTGWQRAIYNRGGGTYGGRQLGRRLP